MPRSHWLTIWASFRTARSSFRSSMKQPLRLRSNAITNGGNVVEILFPAIKPGRIARVETLSIQNLSGETVNASFGIISQGVYRLCTHYRQLVTPQHGQATSHFTCSRVTHSPGTLKVLRLAVRSTSWCQAGWMIIRRWSPPQLRFNSE